MSEYAGDWSRKNSKKVCEERGYKRGDMLYSEQWKAARRIEGFVGPRLKLTGPCTQCYDVTTLPADVRLAKPGEDTRKGVLAPVDLEAAKALFREVLEEFHGPRMKRLRAVHDAAAKILPALYETIAYDDLEDALSSIQEGDLL